MKVSLNVAVKVAEQIFTSGLAGLERPEDKDPLLKVKV
jgi:hypothetical protein